MELSCLEGKGIGWILLVKGLKAEHSEGTGNKEKMVGPGYQGFRSLGHILKCSTVGQPPKSWVNGCMEKLLNPWKFPKKCVGSEKQSKPFLWDKTCFEQCEKCLCFPYWIIIDGTQGLPEIRNLFSKLQSLCKWKENPMHGFSLWVPHYLTNQWGCLTETPAPNLKLLLDFCGRRREFLHFCLLRLVWECIRWSQAGKKREYTLSL